MSENLADKAMHEHSRLIRESPSYRNYLMMEELRAEMQPPLSFSYQAEDIEKELPQKESLEDYSLTNTIDNIYIILKRMGRELSQVGRARIYTQTQLNEHLDKSKKPKGRRLEIT